MTQQPEVMIGHAMDRFDQEGNLTDVVTKKFIIGLLQNLAEWTRRIARDDLPIYIFSGSDDPAGQKLAGVRVLIERYRSVGITSIAHDFYPGGRHEMLHELNRRDVITNLLVWLSGILERSSRCISKSMPWRLNLGAKY
jgi:alpha-beta hydrolase superfamily lysophospholipase